MGNLEFAILFVSTEESPPPGLGKICAFGAWAAGKFISVMKFYWNSHAEFVYPRFERCAINYQQQKSLNDIFKPASRWHRKQSAGRRREWAFEMRSVARQGQEQHFRASLALVPNACWIFSVKLIYGFIGFPARRRLARRASARRGGGEFQTKTFNGTGWKLLSVLAMGFPFSWRMLCRKLSKSQEIYLPENCETP